MDSIMKKRTQMNPSEPNFLDSYQTENMSMNQFDTVAQKDVTKEQLKNFHNEETQILLEKANAEYEAYFKEKTEEIENNAQLSQRKKNKALKKLNKTREDVRAEKMAEAVSQKEMLEFREGTRRARGRAILGFVQQEVNIRVSQEGEALAELSKEESTEIQQDADLLGVMQVPGNFGDTPEKMEERRQSNSSLLKGSKSADGGEGDAFADQLVARVKELSPDLPPNDVFGPVAIQRWRVADHAANLLDKRPEVRERLRQRDPEGLDRIYFMRTRYQMGVDYLDHRTAQASIQFSREFLDKKAESGEFVSKRHQLKAKEKAFGFTLKSGTFEDYKSAKAENLAKLSQLKSGIAETEHELNHGTKGRTIAVASDGTNENFQQALNLVFGNQKLGSVTDKVMVNAEKVKKKEDLAQFNEAYGEQKTLTEVVGELQPISAEELIHHKLNGINYRIEGDSENLGEPIFRAFTSFGRLSSLNAHDPEELAEMIRDLGAGYAVGEEKTEEKTAALREQNIRGLAKFNAISDEHYANVKDKWLGCEHWSLDKFRENMDEFSLDVANIQVDGHVYDRYGHYLPDYGSEAFEERKLLQGYFNSVGMSLSAMKIFMTSPDLAGMLSEMEAGLREKMMNYEPVKIMNERYGGGGAQ